jgi:hypothetical protein
MADSELPIFSLAYTTVRPHAIAQVIKLWCERSTRRSIEWVICVDKDDAESFQAAKVALEANLGTFPAVSRKAKIVVNNGPKTSTAGWNAAAEQTQGKVIIAVADDFVPPRSWDELLLGLDPKTWPDEDRVIHVNDGYVQTLCTLSILTRKRYERFGYLFYPKYQSLFSDTEFTEVAYRDGAVIEAMHLLFEHMHPDCGKRQRDQADLTHASQQRWDSGEVLFNFRRAQGFPLDDGPKAVATAPVAVEQRKERFAAYMQVTKDDLCLLEVCRRLAEEGVSDFFLAQPNEYWSGEIVEPDSQAEISKIVEVLRNEGLDVRHKVFDVPKYRFPGDDRLVVETRVRNDSLAWVRAAGFSRILIADGDELWMRGTLELITPFIEQGHQAISTRMVPVIGLPGYPVDSASDLAVVYIGGTVNFKSCRTPTVRQTVVAFPRIYHFTGTRRTMEETVKKHLRSGHYGDPDYDFDGWLKDVLPNIRPGLENAHMYRKYQIWPKVRDWRADEVQHIPQSIWPYLGIEKIGSSMSDAKVQAAI